MQAGVGWGLFAVIALLIVGFSGGFVWFYKDRTDPGYVTMVVGFVSLFTTLLSLFLIPVDVYITSGIGPAGPAHANDVKYAYYVFYVALMTCFFVGLPFGYFYYEELGDLQDRDNTFCKRACEAMKYTTCFIIIFVALIVIGLFIDLGKASQSSGTAWTHKITDRFSNRTDRILPFVIAVMSLVGLAFSVLYTAWGLAGFPISVMRAAPLAVQTDIGKIDVDLRKVEEEMEYLQSKNRDKASRKQWDRREEIKMKSLERKKNKLVSKRRSTQSTSNYGTNAGGDTCCYKVYACIWNSFAPVRYVIAIIFIVFSCVVVSSILIHLIDQSLYSPCKVKCGFAIDKRHIVNPMGYVLRAAAQYFPLDYIIFSAVIFWLFWCTIWAIPKIGVRLFCLKCFSLRYQRTSHNGLLMALALLILIIVSFNIQMLSLAPTYTMFGHNQNCSLSNTSCHATQIFYFMSAITVGMPVFGLVYFAFCWIYVLVFVISLAYNIFRDSSTDRTGYGQMGEDDELEAVFYN